MSAPMTPEHEQEDQAKAPWGRGEDGRPLLPMGAHWTDIPELVDQHLAGIQARVAQAQPGKWFVSSTAAAPGAVCTQYDGYVRTVGRVDVLPADLELVLHAHSDLNWCLDVIAKLRARVAEREALVPAPIQTCRVCGAGYDYGQSCATCEFKKHMAAAAPAEKDTLEGESTSPEAMSPWERAVAGLNALVDAGVDFHVEPDGHISAPFSDEHIEWDLRARRWVLTHDDEDGAL